MSRIGKQPVVIPKGVQITVDKQRVTAKGGKGPVQNIVVMRTEVL